MVLLEISNIAVIKSNVICSIHFVQAFIVEHCGTLTVQNLLDILRLLITEFLEIFWVLDIGQVCQMLLLVET